MTAMQRGQRSKLEAGGINTGESFSVEIAVAGNAEYDISCFGLTENEKAFGEQYVVFYNNETSPQNELVFSSGGNIGMFQVSLGLLPPQIQKLAFAVTVDGNETMRDISSCGVKVNQNGQCAFALDLKGNDFRSQKAIVTVEIYNKDGWRIRAVGDGFDFNGGLEALMRYYGVDVSDDAPPPPKTSPQSGPAPAPPKPAASTVPAPDAAPPKIPPQPGPAPAAIANIDLGDDNFPPSSEDWV
jgi:tellurite resistance protein TerA